MTTPPSPINRPAALQEDRSTPTTTSTSLNQLSGASPLLSASDEAANPNGTTYCSVLNLIIDYFMAPPSKEFEPDEATAQLVPIVRVFGPIVFASSTDSGHADSSSCISPQMAAGTTKSSCLFLHGAYPYMIARPVLAGMDGRPTTMDASPWDSVSAVQRMITPIQIALEEALATMNQSLLEKNNSRESKSPFPNPKKLSSTMFIIRRITVVTGRGFYTYCDGPVAPFLRVEYYCPADRWKIKRCLEQGLKDLPQTYHPTTNHDESTCDDSEKETSEVLQFHCFEAHIPYTMQFFKDYNLAGAAYIHLDDAVKFRNGPTPNSPLPKQTSCPIEVDATVESILNVLDIITETQDCDDQDNPGGGPIHWRAVPSLKEIWSQERRRMIRLLGSDEALTTFQSSQWKNQSATESAVRGVERLVQVTDGLQEALDRATRDIVERHEARISEQDSIVKSRTMGGVQKTNEAISELTPVDDDAIQLLEGLGNMFDQDENIGDDDHAHDNMAVRNGLSLSQAFHSSAHKRLRSVTDEFELSQRMERGDAIIEDSPFESLDDAIDPETLLPYTPEEEESSDDEDEQALEKQLATLASQIYDNDADDFNTNDYDEPLSTRPPHHPDDISDTFDCPNITDVDQQYSIASTVEVGTSTAHEGVGTSKAHEGVGTNTAHDFELAKDTESAPEWTHDQYTVVQPGKGAPLSSELREKTVHLHPIPSDVPRWTPFIYKYTSGKQISGPYDLPRGIVLPTIGPPTKAAVLRWCDFQKGCEQEASQRNLITKKRRLPMFSNVRKTKAMDLGTDVTSTADDQHQTMAKKTRTTTRVSISYSEKPLQGIGNQGGRIQIEMGGQLKARTKATQLNSQEKREMRRSRSDHLPCPVKMMSVEIHVQRRVSRTGTDDATMTALTADSEKDSVYAIVFVLALDPGGGESLIFTERHVLFVSTDQNEASSFSRTFAEKEARRLKRNMPSRTLGVDAPIHVECMVDERHLLLRFASLVRWKDPDLLMSWDTQGAGLGYIIERGLKITTIQNQRVTVQGIDLARLLGRTTTPLSQYGLGKRLSSDTDDGQSDLFVSAFPEVNRGPQSTGALDGKDHWKGSGLGGEWDDKVGAGQAASSIEGRLVFSCWKIIAEEVKHPNNSYLPSIMSSVLGRRIPYPDGLTLNQWYASSQGRDRWKSVHNCLVFATSSLLLFDAMDVVGRSGEAARLSGVEFSQSFPGIRGSQYKVEGVLLRALKSLNSNKRGNKAAPSVACNNNKSQPQSPWKQRRFCLAKSQAINFNAEAHAIHELSNRSYFFYSPSLQDTSKQEALEVQALTLEPKSGHRESPVVVCDFTALYPSLVIAYNLCYSTCGGKLQYHSTRKEMSMKGAAVGKIGPVFYPESKTATIFKHHIKTINQVKDQEKKRNRAYVVPSGTVFVGEAVVKGVLPQVLDEILTTRAMLKQAAKQYKLHAKNVPSSVLRQLEARQLALKYVANVTYGYTSATFSGRCAMPLLADSIVECGRRTLTNAINLANEWGAKGKWLGAEVIYGDTDSVFVHLPGRSVQEAFQFGEEYCAFVTAKNPPPVQLKLEKVYLGSMMQTKKKYCGMKYDSAQQKEPAFEAKGIETIRRDQCALTKRILEKALVALYSRGLDEAKEYLFRQWNLILSDRVPISEFVLAGRVRSKYRGGRIGPVQAALARRLTESDPGYIVRHKQRQPYVIVSCPGSTFKLKECVMTPMELLEQWDSYSIHSSYYIERHVNAALQRCFGLAPFKIDVSTWYKSCAKPRRRIHFWPQSRTKQNTLMISHFFGSDSCSLCGQKCTVTGRNKASICNVCKSDKPKAVAVAMSKLSTVQREAVRLAQICSKCNMNFEDSTTFASTTEAATKSKLGRVHRARPVVTILKRPLANCICVDCPVTFQRHSIAELLFEARDIVETLERSI